MLGDCVPEGAWDRDGACLAAWGMTSRGEVAGRVSHMSVQCDQNTLIITASLTPHKPKQSSNLPPVHPHTGPVPGVSHTPPLLNHVHREHLRLEIKEIESANTRLFLPVKDTN